MGVLCESCSFSRDKDKEKGTENNQYKIILPRYYLDVPTNENDDKTENSVSDQLKEKENEIDKRNSNIDNNNNNNDDNNNNNNDDNNNNDNNDKNTNKNNFQKLRLSKTIVLDENQEKNKQNNKNSEINQKQLINGNMYNANNIKRSRSLTNNKEINFEKYFLRKSIIIKKDNNQDSINKNNNGKNFRRKNKKSPTLMENSNLSKQLFLVQMSIPVSQELLVIEQKGNPSDKYIKGKLIGSGSFGTVFEAKNKVFNNLVAMKVITKHENMNKLLIQNEINILKKLSHPNIVRIYEFYESKNNFYLINEFCEGGELFNMINKNNFNEQQLSIIFYQVFSGLCYLHENKIFHRDLKPENILISRKEKDLITDEEYLWIKIIDFGTAKIFEKNKKEKSIVGSAYYIAPEVLNKDYNEKCDTWSVGVIIFMFLTGHAPFDGKNNEEIINSIKTKDLNLNDEKLLKHSPEVIDLVKGLLEKDTKKRLSAKEALNHVWFKKFNGRKLFENFKEKDIEPYIDNLFNYTFHSKIQQLVIAFLVHNLPSTDSSINILKLYRYFNESGDCKLTKKELINGLSKYRNRLVVAKKVDHLFLLLDGDNNGNIEFEEFLRACIDKKEILTEEYLKYAYKYLDKENKGNLSVEDINSLFLEGGNKLFEIAITKDISDIDEDGDGNINYQEFKKLMTKTLN